MLPYDTHQLHFLWPWLGPIRTLVRVWGGGVDNMDSGLKASRGGQWGRPHRWSGAAGSPSERWEAGTAGPAQTPGWSSGNRWRSRRTRALSLEPEHQNTTLRGLHRVEVLPGLIGPHVAALKAVYMTGGGNDWPVRHARAWTLKATQKGQRYVTGA